MEAKDRVWAALAQLMRENQRAGKVVLFRMMDGTFAEIGAILEIAPATAHGDWLRALRRLRTFLRDD